MRPPLLACELFVLSSTIQSTATAAYPAPVFSDNHCRTGREHSNHMPASITRIGRTYA